MTLMLLPLRDISGRRQRNTTPCWWLCTHCLPTHTNTAHFGLFDSSNVYSPPFTPHRFFKLRVCTMSHHNLMAAPPSEPPSVHEFAVENLFTFGETEMLFTILGAIVITSVALRHWLSCSQKRQTHSFTVILTHTHGRGRTHTRSPGRL